MYFSMKIKRLRKKQCQTSWIPNNPSHFCIGGEGALNVFR